MIGGNMFEAIGQRLTGIIIGVVAAVGGLVWWDRRKMDQAIKTAAKSGSGGGGGPREPA